MNLSRVGGGGQLGQPKHFSPRVRDGASSPIGCNEQSADATMLLMLEPTSAVVTKVHSCNNYTSN